MAESKDNNIIFIESDDDHCSSESQINKDKDMECPICLQTCIHPAKLPCGHIFCFLCVKGVAYKNKRCAMCRTEIPTEFLDHPQLVLGVQDLCKVSITDDGYQWFYEGRNGWWQYDERTSQDIEDAYKKGDKFCTILVAGYVYVVDFEAMLQQRQNDPSRKRHVKRDLASIPKKGVAGLRIDGSCVLVEHESGSITDHESNAGNYITSVAATDAAIRIASDIIDSTLVHVDEGSQIEDNMLLNNHNTSQELIPRATDLMDAIQTPTTGSDRSNLFARTLDDFRSLTLRNVIDSSDSEDENQQSIL